LEIFLTFRLADNENHVDNGRMGKKITRGRPPKAPGEAKDATPLFIKLTVDERSLIDNAGAPQPSVWARDTLLRAAKRKLRNEK